MKISITMFFMTYLIFFLGVYLVFNVVLKDKEKFLRNSFLIYIGYLLLLLFFLDNIYSAKYLYFSFNKESFSRKYMLSTSVNLKPFFILNFIAHKPTFYGYIFNIICFIPLGFYIPQIIKLNKYNYLRNVLILLLIPMKIEILQFVLPINRVSDIDDFITNVMGAIFGFLMFVIYRRKKIKLTS